MFYKKKNKQANYSVSKVNVYPYDASKLPSKIRN